MYIFHSHEYEKLEIFQVFVEDSNFQFILESQFLFISSLLLRLFSFILCLVPIISKFTNFRDDNPFPAPPIFRELDTAKNKALNKQKR